MTDEPTDVSDDIVVFEEGLVDYDDIPLAMSNIRSDYIDKVREAHQTHAPYRIVISPQDWETVRSRVRRAVTALKLDDEIDVISRKLQDGHIAVFITPKPTTKPKAKGRK